jgi:cyanamide hydratase
MAMAKQQFPDWLHSEETYFITCMLHDIGTTSKNLRATLMSLSLRWTFARELPQRVARPIEQAESVAEVRPRLAFPWMQ